MLIGTAEAAVDCYGCIDSAIKKSDAIPHDQYDKFVILKAKYLGLPQGTKVRITLEIIDEEQP